MLKSSTWLAAGAVCLALAVPASAKISKDQADRLRGDLTPLGAERAGNADGTIPAWTGEPIPIPQGFTGGANGKYPNPFASDQILFTITAENVEEHADKLTAGQIAMFRTYPETFKMNIYPSRRSATYPQWYYDNIYKYSQTAELEADGDGVNNVRAAIPFPIPENGLQAIWNHLMRYHGVYKVFEYDQVTPTVSGNYTIDRVVHYDYLPFYDPNWTGDPGRLFMFVASQLAPPKVNGDQFLFHDHLNPSKQGRNVWRYFAGQRRVRKAPTFIYDTPIPPSYGYRTIDSFDIYFGSPDKYDWDLQGKKEIYIPYNSYDIQSDKYSVEDIVKAGHINPDAARYELHRVWVVDGKLKSGERHIYPRRTMYIDEDSWTISLSDIYDERGELWRFISNHLMNFYDDPTTFSALEVHHDVISRRYNALPLMNDDTKSIDFQSPPPPENFFTPNSIRRLGTR